MSDEEPRDDLVGQTPTAGLDLSASPGAEGPADGAGAEMVDVKEAEMVDVKEAEMVDVGDSKTYARSPRPWRTS